MVSTIQRERYTQLAKQDASTFRFALGQRQGADKLELELAALELERELKETKLNVEASQSPHIEPAGQ